MTDLPARPPHATQRRYVIIAVIVAVVIVLWTGVWFVVRGLVDDRLGVELARLKVRGIAIECPERSVAGYPFRIEVSCVRPSVALARTGTEGSLKGLRAVALIYKPWHLILEADAPLTARGQHGQSVEGQWTLMQSSVRLIESKLAQVSLAGDGLDLTLRLPSDTPLRFTADHSEVHLRPTAAAGTGLVDVDLAITADRFNLSAGRFAIGPADMGLTLAATARKLPPPIGTDRAELARIWVSNGGSVELVSSRLSFGAARIEGKGTLTPDVEGLLSGRLRLVASGLDKLGTGGILGLPPDVSMLASGFLMFGKKDQVGGEPVRVLELVVDRGDMTLGRLPLGSLPPVF